MFDINIYGNPPSIAEVRAMRGSDSIEDSTAFKVFMYTPIPGVDVLAGLTTYAVEHLVFKKDFKACDGAARQDWSSSFITQTYVEKVRAMNRELMHVEVDALNRHLALEHAARAAASAAVSEVANAVTDAVAAKGKDLLGKFWR
jgi:hypothetical protein